MLSLAGDHLKDHPNAPQNCLLRARIVGVISPDSQPSFFEFYTWRHLITGFSKLPLHEAVRSLYPRMEGLGESSHAASRGHSACAGSHVNMLGTVSQVTGRNRVGPSGCKARHQ